MQKIKILHVHAGMNRGGIESAVINILRHIDREKYSFTFLCVEEGKYDYEDELIALGAKIIRTPSWRKVGVITYIRNVRKIMHDNDIDIVHAHSNMVLSLTAAISLGIRSRIAHSHITGKETAPSMSGKVNVFISRLLINLLCTYRVACGSDAGEYSFGKRSFTIIHNGIVLNNFYYSENIRDSVRRKCGIAKDAFVIGHIGRMTPVKNQKFLIDMFEQYLRLKPNSYLLLIGDGSERLENEQYAKARGVTERVKFLGNRGDTGDLYSAMDVFVLPSLNEGLGMVLIEAQVNGLVSLVSDSVPKAARLTDGITFLPLSQGAEQWAAKLYSMDISRYNAISIFHQSPYNIHISVEEVDQLYQKIWEKNNAE